MKVNMTHHDLKVKTSLMVLASGERVFFEVSGQGINPLSCVPFIPHQGAGIEVEVPLMTLPGQVGSAVTLHRSVHLLLRDFDP